MGASYLMSFLKRWMMWMRARVIANVVMLVAQTNREMCEIQTKSFLILRMSTFRRQSRVLRGHSDRLMT